MKQGFTWTLVLGLALSVSALAKGHGDNGNGKGHGKDNPHNVDNDDDDHGRWKARNGWEYRSYDGDERPPGWSHGKKTGWGNCNLPPGQAKKYGCNTYKYKGRDYYWYRDDHERIIVRRPVVHIHAGVDVGL